MQRVQERSGACHALHLCAPLVAGAPPAGRNDSSLCAVQHLPASGWRSGSGGDGPHLCVGEGVHIVAGRRPADCAEEAGRAAAAPLPARECFKLPLVWVPSTTALHSRRVFMSPLVYLHHHQKRSSPWGASICPPVLPSKQASNQAECRPPHLCTLGAGSLLPCLPPPSQRVESAWAR